MSALKSTDKVRITIEFPDGLRLTSDEAIVESISWTMADYLSNLRRVDIRLIVPEETGLRWREAEDRADTQPKLEPVEKPAHKSRWDLIDV